MIHLPVFTRLIVSGYRLFPDIGKNPGISWPFPDGITVIAGINGLGKTTLLNMLLRAITGPYDLAGEGLPEEMASILPSRPVRLNAHNLRFFSQRVADDAEDASTAVTFQIGNSEVTVERSLANLNLLKFAIDGSDQELSGSSKNVELRYQQTITDLCGLPSFVDVILVLHHVVFFTEDRPGALWDPDTQRHVLRALIVESELAAELADFERRVSAADSRFRNIRANAFSMEVTLNELKKREERSPEVAVELEAEQRLLDADLEEQKRLQELLEELDEARKSARLDFERAKLLREEAESSVERIKYTALERLFPTMEDAARLVILRNLTSGECLVCGSDAKARQKELEQLLEKGFCPVCGSDPQLSKNKKIGTQATEQALIRDARTKASTALIEERAALKRRDTTAESYTNAIGRLAELKGIIDERKLREQRLSAELPADSERIAGLKKALTATRHEQRNAEAEKEKLVVSYRILLEKAQSFLLRRSKELSLHFSEYVHGLISEEAELIRIQAPARITQSGDIFNVPAFRAQMSAADRPGKPQRDTPDDVSESQRELIDLAFRLSLIEVATKGSACSLVMETPEASLDELAMHRVGHALRDFANSAGNRLVISSNLTNTGMITSVFGGPTNKAREVERRRKHILNLLDIAAPNQALKRNRHEYEEILETALKGTGN